MVIASFKKDKHDNCIAIKFFLRCGMKENRIEEKRHHRGCVALATGSDNMPGRVKERLKKRSIDYLSNTLVVGFIVAMVQKYLWGQKQQTDHEM